MNRRNHGGIARPALSPKSEAILRAANERRAALLLETKSRRRHRRERAALALVVALEVAALGWLAMQFAHLGGWL